MTTSPPNLHKKPEEILAFLWKAQLRHKQKSVYSRAHVAHFTAVVYNLKPRNNNIPPRDPQQANSRRKSKPKLDVQEPALTTKLDNRTYRRVRHPSTHLPSRPEEGVPALC